MLRLSWTLSGDGWADCVMADEFAEVSFDSSHIAQVPEELITAVARLLTSESETRADFEGEPAGCRLLFAREGREVAIKGLRLPGRTSPDRLGVEVWTSRQPLDVLARTVVRCFDDAAEAYGDEGYRRAWHRSFPRAWHRSFPRAELEALRMNWRTWRRESQAT